MSEQRAYFRYWGKARTELEIDYRSGNMIDAEICQKYMITQEKLNKNVSRNGWKKQTEGECLVSHHLLPYHCLDVAAVAEKWWMKSPAIGQLLDSSSDLSVSQQKAWVMFFTALHDYGKLDIRFQLKAPKALAETYPDFDHEMVDLDGVIIKDYNHGVNGFSLFYYDLQSFFGWDGEDKRWACWRPWLAAVAGHHGVVPRYPEAEYEVVLDKTLHADVSIIDHDHKARTAWVTDLESLFLKRVGLTLHDTPPAFNPLIAGFCSVADWLGSNSAQGAFEFQASVEDLSDYYQQRLPIAQKQLAESGLLAATQSYQGVKSLLPNKSDAQPRQLQLLVDQLPAEQGLTLIEAPTGSGKTEAALAYAWKLLDAGLADSIIFALPTQATANAMLKRLEDVAPILFQNHPNLVLAHGKSAFNDDFWKIKSRSQVATQQGKEEAGVQCGQWLSSSRKRVFLGQIGVCTIDQVLISVLPVRHKFVRGFGIGKSVLIVDEVHAYDSYMYGLLGEVLRQQRQMGGSVLLLSATLPFHQRAALAATWSGDLPEVKNEAYPLVSHVNSNGTVSPYTLDDDDLPEQRTVAVEVMAKPALLADDELIEQMLQAAEQGAQVVFICNLVDVAQATAKKLKQHNHVTVDLFHARYRFCDRQAIEQEVIEKYGKKGDRSQGRILVATQVVEQSLDLDFDWMITQLCPVDLLFQRLGRLHRHTRSRPAGFEQPRCTVLIPGDEDYGYHGLIYGNTRVLWRTAQKLIGAESEINFPGAYRDWIEVVYQDEEWGSEPPAVVKSYDEFLGKTLAAKDEARSLVNSDITEFEDQDATITALTRDGEMSLNILPVVDSNNGKMLLEGETLLADLETWWKEEAYNLNMVTVPGSWRKTGFLPQSENGLILLPLKADGESWQGEFKGVAIRYSKAYGLEKEGSNGKD